MTDPQNKAAWPSCINKARAPDRATMAEYAIGVKREHEWEPYECAECGNWHIRKTAEREQRP